MIWTDNESGPFFVFLLPAVVGCLTILLARRWANTQGSTTSSTAVSRRRKIIKDPLIKRPLPTLSCKMVAPLKKPTTAGKRVSYPNDDDMMSNGRRLNRTSHPPTGSDTKGHDGQMPPKHIPFPYIPQDGELLFEAMTFMFVLVATGLQYLNIYRTSWWLPHLDSHQTMNFYLIDIHVVAVILAILFRRVLYAAIVNILRVVVDPKDMPKALVATRLLVMGILGGCVGGCLYFIILKYPPMSIFFLCYPSVIYFWMFGFQTGPFLELGSQQSVFHSCSSDPELVATEVDSMRQDFNDRVSRVLLYSTLGAYYSSFIPCCTAQSFVYYDLYGAAQQVSLVWAGLFARYTSQLVNASLCDTWHRASLHLPLLYPELVSDSPESSWWSRIKFWIGGTIEGVSETKIQHARFYKAFKNPSTLLSVFLCLQLSLIALQLCLLFSSVPWNSFLSTLLLLFMNYYTLFKMVRDYMVAWKVYKAEGLIQEKNASLAATNTN